MTVDETPRSGIDRRSALKKAAIAGTVAWTAPAILSETAHAVELIGPCTAKCAPTPSLAIQPTTGLVCNTNGAKWAGIVFFLTDVVCPCQTGFGSSFLGATVSPQPADVKSVTFDEATGTGLVTIGGQGQGALGNGTYTAELNFCVQCNDRTTPTPDVIRRFCTATITFTFAPADGPCSSASNVGPATLNGTSCGDAECAICPAPT